MELKVDVSQTKSHVVTVSPVGPINSDTYTKLDAVVTRVLAGPVKTLVLNMEGVKSITSAGIGVVVKAKASLKRKGADVAMINLPPQIRKVFEIIRLLPVLNVFENTEELDNYLETIQRRMTGDSDEF